MTGMGKIKPGNREVLTQSFNVYLIMIQSSRNFCNMTNAFAETLIVVNINQQMINDIILLSVLMD